MKKQLMIIEVSQKQAYIFASRDLAENQRRSLEIARVTSEEYFRLVCPKGYDPTRNTVYTGGGHAVLQFPSKAAADTFARALTLQVLRDYPEMELFVRQCEYNAALAPGENLLALSKALEEKKALRAASFRMKHLGLEADPRHASNRTGPSYYTGLADNAHYLAIVHIDGNAMGARVAKVYEQSGTDWDRCVASLQRFSAGIDADYSAAYDAMVADLREQLHLENADRLPLYKIIAAGDDLCFITSAEHALECTASYLRHLSKRKNPADGGYYSACAGIAIISKETEFRQGYDLSESLCVNAKRFAAAHGSDISALDFQIVDGVPKGSLQEIREDYRAEDGSYLLLRPVAVTGTVPEKYTYTYLTAMLRKMQHPARNKLLENRHAFYQGQQEVRFALHMARAQLAVNRMLHGNPDNHQLYFTDPEGHSRCLFFDALELAPFAVLWEGGPHEQNPPKN